jgi:hypothetical protein
MIEERRLGKWYIVPSNCDENLSIGLAMMGFQKAMDIKSEKVFRDIILPSVHSYFDPLIPCLERLRGLVARIQESVCIGKRQGTTGKNKRVVDSPDELAKTFKDFKQILWDAYNDLPPAPGTIYYSASTEPSSEFMANQMKSPVGCVALADSTHAFLPPNDAEGKLEDHARLLELSQASDSGEKRNYVAQVEETLVEVPEGAPKKNTIPGGKDLGESHDQQKAVRSPYANIANAVESPTWSPPLTKPAQAKQAPHSPGGLRRKGERLKKRASPPKAQENCDASSFRDVRAA